MDTFDYYIEQISMARCREEASDSNTANIEAIRYVMPIIIENELTEKQKACFKMKFYDNMTQEDIAKSLNLTQPTISKNINAAKREVRKYLHYSLLAAKRTSMLLN